MPEVNKKMRLFPSSSCLPRGPSKGENNRANLYLNVYDLTPMNNYLYWVGLGVFHSAIEVYGSEYAFGAHEFAASGVFEVVPRSCPGFIYRRSIFLGRTEMSSSEFRSFMERISAGYHGDTYHLISKNCNHFTDDVSKRLTGKSIPGWVNRLAHLVSGSFFGCILPASIQAATVRHLPDGPAYSEDESDSASNATAESEEEDVDHHLLTIPNDDVEYLKEKPVRLAKDLM